ncbi:MAG TPA: putative sugar O-methyltransferase [Solirubrobacteraceae bacterium]|jgi:putative sugar O-methyltransferase|nr:putative sugar O-methyltransferase [Solirubrobacteraceae bacterium]
MSWVRSQAHRIRSHRLAIVDRHPRPAHPELVITDADERYLTSPYDRGVPLPDTAGALHPANPALTDLRRRYAALDLPPLAASRWNPEAVDGFLDHRYFRGDSLITWHYRELPRATRLKYFVYAQYVRSRDDDGLLDRLEEDGAFGCWTFTYSGHPRYSRDLIESVNEILFLERELALRERARFSVLDVGAGYGRLAHRVSSAYPNLDDYCCVDAIPDSTFLCDYYLRHRGCRPPARAVALDECDRELRPGGFDLAVNVHSFPECTYDAVRWWIELIARLEIPHLLIVPNEPGGLRSLEADGTHRDFRPVIDQAGYAPVRIEPVIADPAVAELVRVHDEFHLFRRR